MSSSSWGCELKCYTALKETANRRRHPLREDVSWNIVSIWYRLWNLCHPLREDVSWNALDTTLFHMFLGHPLREDVSWNVLLEMYFLRQHCHPLREDVSWNLHHTFLSIPHQSSSSWGCELKYSHAQIVCVGCGHPLREDVSWNTSLRYGCRLDCVILFVRMWVEMSSSHMCHHSHRHPLREDVSWNNQYLDLRRLTVTSSSSWGCELKWFLFVPVYFQKSHPLREDVSWNFKC